MKKNKAIPLLSIIVPVYGTEKFLRKCLDSLLVQTYPNIEIIVVDDCSPDNSAEIIQEYVSQYSNVHCVKNSENQGLYKARLRGYEVAQGEYICSVDSDDYVGIDYYHLMMNRALETDADIVVSKFIIHNIEKETFSYRTYGNYAIEGLDFTGEDIILNFYNTDCESSHYWLVWNKVYKKSLWDRSYTDLLKLDRHHIMLEDIVYGSVLMTNANRYISCDADSYYYVKHPEASTGISGGFNKLFKNLTDQSTAFNFIEEFFRSKGLFEKVEKGLICLREKQARVWDNMIKKYILSPEEKLRAESALKVIASDYQIEIPPDIDSFFYREFTPWNNQYETLKQTIVNPKFKYISFDMFDTLVLRPFLKPTDLFCLLDHLFDELVPQKTLVRFSEIRINAEKRAREIYGQQNRFEDITISEIYTTLVKEFNIQQSIADILLEKEKELEIRFCYTRQKVKELYDLAVLSGKNVICTTDVYLDRNTLISILNKNGYTQVKAIFISSEERLTKATGHLYKMVLERLKIDGNEMLHIGDNWTSDIVNAKKHGIESFFVPKTTDLFCNIITDSKGKKNKSSLYTAIRRNPTANFAKYNFSEGYFGFRCMLGMVANKMFDHPHLSYEPNTDFNRNPYYVGYFALGMHLFGIVEWLIKLCKKRNYETIHFVARDGFSAMKVYEIVSQYYPNAPKFNYFYMSRKSFLPLTIVTAQDLYYLPKHLTCIGKTPLEIIELLKPILNCDDLENMEGIYRKHHVVLNRPLESKEDYTTFAAALIALSYDHEKNLAYRERMRKHFSHILGENDVMFDIGYSGRAQAILSNLLGYGVHAAYVHYLNDQVLTYSDRFHFYVDCYYDYTPTIIGKIREVIQSDTIGSCIGYQVSEDAVFPVLEESNYTYHNRFVIERIHKGACDFAKDFMDTFSDYLPVMNYRDFDLGFAHEHYMHHPARGDMHMFSAFYFEDDVLQNKNYAKQRLTDIWWKDLKWNRLTNGGPAHYSKEVDIDFAPKWKKVLYYALFDRKTLKEKVKNRVRNKPMLYWFLKWGYGTVRSCYRGLARFCSIKEPQKLVSVITPPNVSQNIDKIGALGKILYSATSEYGILCCMIHKLIYNPDKSCVLMISEWRRNKKELVEASMIFDDVILFNDFSMRKISSGMDEKLKEVSERDYEKYAGDFLKILGDNLPFDPQLFDKIIVTNTTMPFSIYLEYKEIAYDAFEEGAGLYSDPTLLDESIKAQFPLVEQWLIKRYDSLNNGLYCKRWYVNYAAQTQAFDKSKTEDFTPIPLFAQLKPDEQDKILHVFNSNFYRGEQVEGNACLILTYPLVNRLGISFEEQQFIYACFADMFSENGEIIYLKLHPDDHLDYTTLGNHIRVLPTGTLSELISYETGAHFQRAVSAVSTAMNNLAHIPNKVYFDKGIVTHYQELIRYFVMGDFIRQFASKKAVVGIGTYDMMLKNVNPTENCSEDGTIYVVGSGAEKNDIMQIAERLKEEDMLLSLEEFEGSSRILISKQPQMGFYLCDLQDEFLYVRTSKKRTCPFYMKKYMPTLNVDLVAEEVKENI